LVFGSSEEANRAFIACTKARIVPYGSYVLNDDTRYPRQWKNGKPTIELRVENTAWLEALIEYLEASPYKTYEALREHYIEEGMWSN
jgi:hypothetical protein